MGWQALVVDGMRESFQKKKEKKRKQLLSWPPAPTTPGIQLGSLTAMGSRGRGQPRQLLPYFFLLSIHLEKEKEYRIEIFLDLY